MVYNAQTKAVLIRIVALAATLAGLILVLSRTDWYATAVVLSVLCAISTFDLLRIAAASGQELARFLEALAFDDAMAGFSVTGHKAVPPELTAAMERVMSELRQGRAAAEEEAQYRQALLMHMPVALMAGAADGAVQLLNPAARRLFGEPVTRFSDCERYGAEFSTGLSALVPGGTALLKMERGDAALYLKVAATAVVRHGARQTLYSFQNIAGELNAQELAAWQTVIRTMAHEVMNSLTPISSLSATAGDIVKSVRDGALSEMEKTAVLDDAVEALDTVARRADGLMGFVQNHRRLTRRLTATPERLAVARVFARLQRLLAADIAARGLALSVCVDPPLLEVTADADLLDQALINLMRNAMEALKDTAKGVIAVSGARDGDGHPVLCVSDNGPGIAADERERIFVPFYTTKRQGTGIGLTLVRQIAAVHGADLSVTDTPGGGATFRLRF